MQNSMVGGDGCWGKNKNEDLGEKIKGGKKKLHELHKKRGKWP